MTNRNVARRWVAATKLLLQLYEPRELHDFLRQIADETNRGEIEEDAIHLKKITPVDRPHDTTYQKICEGMGIDPYLNDRSRPDDYSLPEDVPHVTEEESYE